MGNDTQWHKKKRLEPTVKQFQQLVLLETDDSVRGFDKELRFCAIMTGQSNEEVERRLSSQEIIEINKRYNNPSDSALANKLTDRIWIGKKLFKVCPDFTRLIWGEFISFEHFTRSPKTTVQELHNILALLTRPIPFPYFKTRANNWTDDEEERAEDFNKRATYLQEEAPAWLGLALSGFFLQVWSELSDPIPTPTPGSPPDL